MGKAGKIWLVCASIAFIGFMLITIQTFKPVRNVTADDLIQIEGIVVDVQEAPGFDIAITLKNDPHYYYINRGLQLGLDLEQLRRDILNKKVTLYSIKRWTIFTRDKIMGHISKLVMDQKTLFTELKNEIHEQNAKEKYPF